MCEKVMCDDGIEREVISREEAKERGLKRYFTGKPCKHGHVAERVTSNGSCIVCNRDKQKRYYNKYPDRAKERKRKYLEKNGEKSRAYSREYYWRNPEARREKRKKHYYENKAQNLEKAKERQKRRFKEDPDFRVKVKCRNMLNRVLKFTGDEKSKRTQEILGYSSEELKDHLESRFSEGMSWDNAGKWHIDHLKSISTFMREGYKEPSIINSLDNLAPMWAEHNLEKGESSLEEYLEKRPDLASLYGHLLEK